MFRQFAQKVEEMMRLIENQRSASSVISGEPDESRNLFLLAVSGGMDSMCMADLFLRETGKDNFAVAHCNFSLRGDESDGDEALVRDWAESNGVRLFVKRFDTSAYAKAHGISIEMAARDLRYGWFAELCQENDFAVLAVAHNANDNAETLMLNLLRGTGLSGLHGMAEVQYRVDLNRSGCDSASGEGKQYQYYTEGGSRIRSYLTGSSNGWWERSPDVSRAISFCAVSYAGNTGYLSANAAIGVAFGLSI